MAEEKGLGKLKSVLTRLSKTREGGTKTASSTTEKALIGGVEAYLANIEGVLAQMIGSVVCGQDNKKTFKDVSNLIKAKNPLMEKITEQTKNLQRMGEIAVSVKKNKDNFNSMFKHIGATPLILKLMSDTLEEDKKYRMDKDKEWKKFAAYFNKDSEFQKAMEKVAKLSISDSIEDIQTSIEELNNPDKKKQDNVNINIAGINDGNLKGLSELVESVTKVKGDNIKMIQSLVAALTLVSGFSNNGDLSKAYEAFKVLNSDFFDAKSGIIIKILDNLSKIEPDVTKKTNNAIAVINNLSKVLDVIDKAGKIGIGGIMKAYFVMTYASQLFQDGNWATKGPGRKFIKSLNKLPEIPKSSMKTIKDLNTAIGLIGEIGSFKNVLGTTLANMVFMNAVLTFMPKVGPGTIFIKSLSKLPQITSKETDSLDNINLVLSKIASISKTIDIKSAIKVRLLFKSLAGAFKEKGSIYTLVQGIRSLQDKVDDGSIELIANIHRMLIRLSIIGNLRKDIKNGVKTMGVASDELSPVLRHVIEDFGKIGELAKEQRKTMGALSSYIMALVSITHIDSQGVKESIKGFEVLNDDLMPIIKSIVESLIPMDVKGAEKKANELFKLISIVVNFPTGSVDNITESIKALKEVTKEIDSVKDLQDKLKSFKTALAEIEEVFDKTKAVGIKGEGAAASTKKINKGLDDVNKTATGSGNKAKNAKRATISMKEIAGFIMMASVVMLIGGWIITKNPELVAGAMQFGVVLMAFITLVMAPFMLMSVLCKTGMQSVKGFAGLIIACTFVMMLGAMFMQMGGGKMVKYALQFGVVLGLFEALVVAPFLMFAFLKVCVANSIKAFRNFMFTCTVVMMLGALFMMMGNGKWVANALAFGLVLMMFETLVVLPFLVFSILGHKVDKAIVHFTAFVIVCTVVMLIGSLFMDRKMHIGALEFAKTLAIFELAVVTPVLLLRVLMTDAWKVIKQLTIFMAVATAVMLIGAHFMKKGLAGPALKFTGILALFELGVILPTLALKGLTEQAYKVMLGISIFMSVATLVLMGGAIFIQKYGTKSILEFAGVLVGFITIMSIVMGILGAAQQYVQKGTIIALWLAGAVAALSLSMMLVHTTVKAAGGWSLLEDVGILLAATGIIAAVFVIIGIPQVAAFVALGGAVALLMGIAISSLSIAFFLLHTLVEKNPAVDALKLGLAIAALLIPFGFMGMLIIPLGLGSIVGTLMGVAIGTLSVAFFMLHLLEFDSIIGDAVKLAAAIGIMMIPFTLLGVLSPLIAIGSIVAVAMSVALSLLSLSFGLVHVIVSKKVTSDAGRLMVAIGLMGVIFTMLGALSPIILLGSIAGLAMSIALTTLSGAFALVHLIARPELLKEVLILAGAIAELNLVCLALLPMIVTAPLAMIAAAFLLPLIFSISASLSAMGTAMLIVKKVGDFKADKIKSMIKDFIGITDACPGLLDYLSIMSKIGRLSTLGYSISRLAYMLGNTVQFMADLKVATKWNGDGDPIKFKQLNESDFAAAANGIKTILTTLAGAIVETYTNYPLLFGDKAEDILIKVRRLAYAEAKMITYLANSLQSYAQLLIPTGWDKEGNPVRFRTMKETDFENAAKGIGSVLTTLGKAISDVYLNDLQNGGNLFGWKGEEIVERVKEIAMAEGDMISTLSQGLISYAQIMIPTAWNKNGVPVRFRQMGKEEFAQAAENIGTVMTTMAIAIRTAWTGKSSTVNGITFKGDGKGLQSISSGGLFGKSIDEIIEELSPMGNLIASMAEGLQHYASLVIPDRWDKNGKPIHFLNVNNSGDFFSEAAGNIEKIITTTATAIKTAYDTLNKGLFSDPEEIISSMAPMGELISNMAEGLQQYAMLSIPIHWTNGKPDKFRTMTKPDFENAATNIGTILSMMTGVIYATWTGKKFTATLGGHKLSFGGIALKDSFDSDEFSEILDGFCKVGDLISSIAEGIVNYAALSIPIHWNDGKPDKFRTLNTNDFTAAGINISKVLHAVLFADSTDPKKATGGIIGAWNNIKDKYDPDDLQEIMEAFLPVGDFVSNMAESIHNYAELLIPTRWNDEGKAVKFRQMKPADFANAGKGINRILSCMITAITGFVNTPGGKELFEDGENSVFAQTVAALCGLGEMISNIAEGVNMYASGQVPTDWDPKTGKPIMYKNIGQKEYTDAAVNIGLILSVLGQSVIDFASKHPQYFDTTSGDSKFKVAIDSVKDMGKLIKDISDGVQTFANGGIPKYNKDGKIIGYDKFPDGYFEMAANNIKNIISIVGKAVVDFYNGKDFQNFTSEHGDFAAAMTAITKIGTAVKNVAEGVQAYANLAIPTSWDKDGKPKGMHRMSDTELKNAPKNIATLIQVLAKGIIDGYTGENSGPDSVGLIALMGNNSPLNDILETLKTVGDIINVVTKTIQDYASLKIPTGFDNNGKAKGYNTLDKTDIGKMRENLVKILTELPKIFTDTAVLDAYKEKGKGQQVSATTIIDTMSSIADVIKSIVSIAKIFSDNEKSLGVLFKHNKQYKGNVENLTIGYIADTYGILSEISELGKLFNTKKENFNIDETTSTKILNAINNIDNIIGSIVDLIKDIVKYDEDIKKFMSNKIFENVITIIGDKNTQDKNTLIKLIENIQAINIEPDFEEKINDIVNYFDIIDGTISSIIYSITNIKDYYYENEDAIKYIIDDTNAVASNIDKVIKIMGAIGVSLTNDDFNKLYENTLNYEELIEGIVHFKDIMISIATNIEAVENVFNEKYKKVNKFALESKYVTLIENIVDKINAFQDVICGYNLIGSDTLEQALGNTKHAKKVIDGLEYFKKMIDTLMNQTIAVKSTIDASRSELTSFVKIDQNEYIKLVQLVVKTIGRINEELEKIDDFDDIVKNVVKMKYSIEQLISLANAAYKVNPKSFEALINGINNVTTTLNNVKYSETFQKNVNQLDKFVRVVNSVSLNKLNPLIELSKQMNMLAKRMGNLDKLTDAIANALSGVLQELVKQIKHAEKTIKDADVLQKRRHQLINESMNKIKGIMENPLIVQVEASQTPAEGAEGGSPGGGGTDTNGTPVAEGGGADKQNGGPIDEPNESYNDVGVAPGHGNNNPSSSSEGGKKEAKSGTDYLLKQILNTLRSQGAGGRNRK